jgi:uncharacterized RDD family membrane protein YckC
MTAVDERQREGITLAQDPNPYRPPQAPLETSPARGMQRPRSGKGRRLATLLIDYVACRLLILAFWVIAYALQPGRLPTAHRTAWAMALGVLFVAIFYVFFEGLFGRTPGKLILGTVVTDLEGNPPTLDAVIKRTLARFVPFEAFTFFGERGFHDKASRTQVVRTR